MEEAALDDIIDRLLDVRNGRPGKQVGFATAPSVSASPVVTHGRLLLATWNIHQAFML
jgi:hypothetical protein